MSICNVFCSVSPYLLRAYVHLQCFFALSVLIFLGPVSIYNSFCSVNPYLLRVYIHLQCFFAL